MVLVQSLIYHLFPESLSRTSWWCHNWLLSLVLQEATQSKQKKTIMCDNHCKAMYLNLFFQDLSHSKGGKGWQNLNMFEPPNSHDLLATAWSKANRRFLSISTWKAISRSVLLIYFTCSFFCIWISVRGLMRGPLLPRRIILLCL